MAANGVDMPQLPTLPQSARFPNAVANGPGLPAGRDRLGRGLGLARSGLGLACSGLGLACSGLGLACSGPARPQPTAVSDSARPLTSATARRAG
jgi:hypothetical protein